MVAIESFLWHNIVKLFRREFIMSSLKMENLTIMTITPETAQSWLDNNLSSNRRIKPKHVDFLTNEILAGRWDEGNPTSFVISDQNQLLNGQHRAHAIIRSGVSVRALVMVDRPTESFKTIDKGRSRDLHDTLDILGKKNSYALASTLRLVVCYECEHWKKSAFAEADQLDALHRHPMTEIAVEMVTKSRAKKLYLVAPFSFVLTFALEYDYDKASEFFRQCTEIGVSLDPQNAVYHLVKRGVDIHRKKKSWLEECALYVKAWNAFQADTPLKRLSWHGLTEKAEPFPRLVGT